MNLENQIPAISVIVPIYNQEKYLEECLNSIVNQTLKNIEIICINGGSTDGTVHILEQYAERDPRIKYINGANLGYAHNMNLGLELALGEYIATVDSDDYIALETYEVLYKCAKENDLDVLKYRHYYFKGHNEIIAKRNIVDAYNYNKVSSLQERNDFYSLCIPIWSGIYKNEFIRENNIRLNEDKKSSFNDNGFTFQVYILAKRMLFSNDIFYYYRNDNPNSLTYNSNVYQKIYYEYKYIYQFLMQESERFHKYKYLYHYMRYKNYGFALSVTPEEERISVLHQISQEYKDAIQKKEVEPDIYFDKKEWENFINIASFD